MSAATRFAHDRVLRTTLAAWALAPLLTHADVYKCAGEGGIPVYQEMPCAAGKELRNFQIDPPEITVLPAPRATTASPAPKDLATRDAKPGGDAKSGKPVRPAGDASERKHAHVGMTEAEVLARLGSPDVTTGNAKSGSIRWTYLPADGDPETITALVLTKGTVTDVERKVVKK
jgi:hypothetical protein